MARGYRIEVRAASGHRLRFSIEAADVGAAEFQARQRAEARWRAHGVVFGRTSARVLSSFRSREAGDEQIDREQQGDGGGEHAAP
jgi:hypothetical protein